MIAPPTHHINWGNPDQGLLSDSVYCPKKGESKERILWRPFALSRQQFPQITRHNKIIGQQGPQAFSRAADGDL